MWEFPNEVAKRKIVVRIWFIKFIVYCMLYMKVMLKPRLKHSTWEKNPLSNVCGLLAYLTLAPNTRWKSRWDEINGCKNQTSNVEEFMEPIIHDLLLMIHHGTVTIDNTKSSSRQTWFVQLDSFMDKHKPIPAAIWFVKIFWGIIRANNKALNDSNNLGTFESQFWRIYQMKW